MGKINISLTQYKDIEAALVEPISIFKALPEAPGTQQNAFMGEFVFLKLNVK